MAHIEDRWYHTITGPNGRKRQGSAKPGCGKGMRYRVRYIGPDGRERSESFPDGKKREAQDFLNRIQTDIRAGTYVDPDAGRISFRQYAAAWLAAITVDELTHDRLEYELRLHIYPAFGDLPIVQAAQVSTIRAWAKRIQDAGLSPGYRRKLFEDVSMIFNAAVDDKKIASNPFAAKTIRPPQAETTRVVPWPIQLRAKFRANVESRYRVAVDLGAGCGLRQGEIFGISPDDVDPHRPILHVVRQVKVVRSRLIFALPKGGKTREAPLPDSVAARLKAHAKEYPPMPVTLPWGSSTGQPRTVQLYLYTTNGAALNRPTFNSRVWRPALRATGIPRTRQNGMHVLRHTYASVLLDAGESIRALAAYLGHADPGFTLRTYTHLLPTSEDRTRRAIDQAFRDDPEPDDGLNTA
jgi:integrase